MKLNFKCRILDSFKAKFDLLLIQFVIVQFINCLCNEFFSPKILISLYVENTIKQILITIVIIWFKYFSLLDKIHLDNGWGNHEFCTEFLSTDCRAIRYFLRKTHTFDIHGIKNGEWRRFCVRYLENFILILITFLENLIE